MEATIKIYQQPDVIIGLKMKIGSVLLKTSDLLEAYPFISINSSQSEIPQEFSKMNL